MDIRGLWKYQDLLDEYRRLQVRASKAMLTLQSERDEARRECERLKERCDEQRKDLRALRLQCGALDSECERLHLEKDAQYKARKAARAEAEELKKIRWRWLDAEHGWWPVEGVDIDEMVQKVPYVLYAADLQKRRVPEI